MFGNYWDQTYVLEGQLKLFLYTILGLVLKIKKKKDSKMRGDKFLQSIKGILDGSDLGMAVIFIESLIMIL